jgi:hypothetical protein
MSKPLLERTRWASTVSPTAPSSGQRDSGWTLNQLAISSYFNSLAKAYYDWFSYLDTIFGASLNASGVSAVGYDAAGTQLVDLAATRATNVAKFTDIDATGNIKHGDYQRHHSCALGTVPATGVIVDPVAKLVQIQTTKTARTEVVGLMKDDRVKKIIVTGEDATTALAFVVGRKDSDGSAVVPLAYTSVRLGAAGGPFEYTFTLTTPLIVPAGSTVTLETTSTGGTGTIYHVGVVWDRI